jgi:proteic killer suppression protein
MDARFRDTALDRLESDARFGGGYPPAVVKMFRKRMQQIRAFHDERDFYHSPALRCEKLKGPRSHQHSIRLNDQWRLIFELEGKGSDKVVTIVSIEDYH